MWLKQVPPIVVVPAQEKALQEQSEARKEKARLAKEKKLQPLGTLRICCDF